MYYWRNEENKIWFEDYVERETAVARMPVEDAETAIKQQPEDMRQADTGELITGEPEITFQVIVIAVGDSLSDLAYSDNQQDGDDEDAEHTELSKLSKDEVPGGVLGAISKTVQQHIEGFWQK